MQDVLEDYFGAFLHRAHYLNYCAQRHEAQIVNFTVSV